jgi:hypothetical protein
LKTRVLIVDDEPIARRGIRRYLAEHDGIARPIQSANISFYIAFERPAPADGKPQEFQYEQSRRGLDIKIYPPRRDTKASQILRNYAARLMLLPAIDYPRRRFANSL